MNPLPQPCEGCALPDELRPQSVIDKRIPKKDAFGKAQTGLERIALLRLPKSAISYMTFLTRAASREAKRPAFT